ncbi:PREDICTED: uncharacterized protein LOC104809165 [Tarenaya hassleriana]|uniref:uncharacterized protein LOC104803384 n=1 Tax=Tarenaya hassleriana TaxID=28532 RepID=UPI00053C71E1|nr:PREDICTED: uncharacterized protein LOC104803384 [Tarenaya hassleriana]XP_010533356.1 PREDICTED: uncharacterized protein LOC104809165 [Tarenaya hassleriana]
MAEVTERIPRAITIEARIQQARVSRSQPTGSIRTPLMKHAKLLVKAEGLFTKGMELLSQIRAEHDKFLTDYLQCGGEHDPGTEDGRNMDKGKDKVVDDSEEEVD